MPKVLTSIRDITAALDKVAKDGRGPQAQGSFPFMPVESIIEQLKPLIVEHDLILREHVVHVDRETDTAIKATPNGDPIYDGRLPTTRVRVEAKIEWTFIHVEDGSEFTVTNYGEAHDVADKAIRKANTAAYKEMLLRTFWVVAGEKDPDGIDPNAEAEAVSERRNRGQQKVDNARPTAGRTTARKSPAPKVPAPEVSQDPAPADPADNRAGTPTPGAEPVTHDEPAQPTPTPAPESAPEPAAAPEFTPDPEDIAFAEQQAPAPGTAPVQATTQAEKRSENVSALKNELRRAWSARGMSREDVNELGRKKFGTEPSAFLFNAANLKALMAAVEAGEMA